MSFYRRSYQQRGNRRVSRFTRRRPFLRQPTEPKRWEVGRVEFDQNVVLTEEDNSQVIFAPLALIFDRVGDATTAQGRTLNNMARRIEVGGVVLDYAVHWSIDDTGSSGNIAPPGVMLFNAAEAKFILATDRLFEDGAPAALAPQFFNSTTPVTLASTSSLDEGDMTYPMRIHHEDTFFWRAQQFKTNAPAVIPAWPQISMVSKTQGRVNRRLKLSLSDDQVLGCYLAAVWYDTTADYTSVNAQFVVSGKIYYRIRW